MKPLKHTQEDWDRLNNWFEERTGLKKVTLHEHMNKMNKIYLDISKELYWHKKTQINCKHSKNPIPIAWYDCKSIDHKLNDNDKEVGVCCYDLCPLQKRR